MKFTTVLVTALATFVASVAAAPGMGANARRMAAGLPPLPPSHKRQYDTYGPVSARQYAPGPSATPDTSYGTYGSYEPSDSEY
ncbi:hypothetical protein CYLTODRAFT_421974 [Cylindrobasidium torrendii FP15055 ss-10]|uniref:Uncharacterized protein n=1 Tax=Cylindrobasidium torrendii FP15055 ss-10 TaxID=1314674 RepID=A0A0D7BEK5_9AGAR|nr:hypothetical protein CYLTODRAFT_421974 [Cylindrobasidium torrendii FP15055 ss-10]